jgi:hypothetical protein
MLRAKQKTIKIFKQRETNQCRGISCQLCCPSCRRHIKLSFIHLLTLFILVCFRFHSLQTQRLDVFHRLRTYVMTSITTSRMRTIPMIPVYCSTWNCWCAFTYFSLSRIFSWTVDKMFFFFHIIKSKFVSCCCCSKHERSFLLLWCVFLLLIVRWIKHRIQSWHDCQRWKALKCVVFFKWRQYQTRMLTSSIRIVY